ncbi:hypothetical protein BCV70DRAFT_45752 [Testicularia cyperi]|uniref:Uncharacterized protein n=1 Tax=Testicularia cyperi TaxID=1882483 RepID=A0A317XJZ2_9BASI|nr:hypothetical protein BCV70DRAFT_45752 [Testicularia cyperi]
MLRNAVSRSTLKAVGQGGSGGSSIAGESMHPNLGLHSAAATGNIGLVKFALENGQPANSSLNGILPLHAACSGGSEQSVRMLILYGADVNAPRAKSKGSAGPGAEGSTPLHFAAANGHLDIVRILLEAGARPAAADKDGVVAEALALGNGHDACAHLIRSWISAYGSNGLAGLVSSRDTVSGDVALGPAGYIRYAASSSSSAGGSVPRTSIGAIDGISPSTTPTRESSGLHATQHGYPQSLRNQRSYETLASSSSSKTGTSRSNAQLRKASLAKTSSNPNLRALSPSSTSSFSTPVVLNASSSSASSPASGPAMSLSSQGLLTTSPVKTFATLGGGLPQQSPQPLLPEEEAELAFATGLAPAQSRTATAGSGTAPANMSSTLPRESKRRPSLPSILEKAAHPAASLKAALGSSTSASGANMHASSTATGGGSNRLGVHHSAGSSLSGDSGVALTHFPLPNNGADPYEQGPLSPSRKTPRMSGKRSISNILRKATGGSSGLPSTSSTSSVNTLNSIHGDGSVGSIDFNSLTKPGRVSHKSFEQQRPPPWNSAGGSSSRLDRRGTAAETQGGREEGSDIPLPLTAPSHQTSFPKVLAADALPHGSRSSVVDHDSDNRLRSTSSSSSLSLAGSSSSSQPTPSDGSVHGARARSSSNDQIAFRAGRAVGDGGGLLASGRSGSNRGNASLDLLRPAYSTSGSGSGSGSRNGSSTGTSFSTLPIAGHDHATARLARRRSQSARKDEIASIHGDAGGGGSSEVFSSDGSAHRAASGHRARAASTSSSVSSSGIRHHVTSSSSHYDLTDADDAQEFLAHPTSNAAVDDAGEHHDEHHLPAGLRNLTALRQQSSSSDLTANRPAPSSIPDSLLGSSAGTFLQHRNRSGSSLSAVSTGSQSSQRGVSSTSTPAYTGEPAVRNSPGLGPTYTALSIADENGMARSPSTSGAAQMRSTGSTISVGSDNLSVRPSPTVMRPTVLSAAEQANAILNQEGPYSLIGPDGTSVSLAAQLAAYGEALALERRRAAGEARTGPSPSLSTRGSNAALRSKLPSVSEDHSPVKVHGSVGPTEGDRVNEPGEDDSELIRDARSPTIPATAAQSYNRRVSRRPHSSEGRESAASSRVGQFGSVGSALNPVTKGPATPASTIPTSATEPVSRSGTPGSAAISTTRPAGLRNMFLDAPKLSMHDMQNSKSGDATTRSGAIPPEAGASSFSSSARSGLGSPMLPHPSGSWTSKKTGDTLDTDVTGPGSRMTIRRPTLPSAEAFDMQRRLSEDLLRQQRQQRPPPLPTKDVPATRCEASLPNLGVDGGFDDAYTYDDDPTTPVLSSSSRGGFDIYATSPRSVHRHSPSMPTELSSYTTARQGRSPAATLRSDASLTPPIPPPRKESIQDSAQSPGAFPFATSNSGGTLAGRSGFLTPDSGGGSSSTGTFTPGRNAELRSPSTDEDAQDSTAAGNNSSSKNGHGVASRWDGFRRPSLNMIRSATSTSAHSQCNSSIAEDPTPWTQYEDLALSHTSTIDDLRQQPEHGSGSASSSSIGGKRGRLVRNLINNIKGNS